MGGTTLLPGFDLSLNETVFFGGTDCPSYLPGTVYTPACLFTHPGYAWRFGATPVGAAPVAVSTITAAPAPAPGLGYPARAGMAAARGVDGAGNTLILGYGGVSSPGSATDTGIWYIAGIAGSAYQWRYSIPPGAGPAVVANGAMVYSHTTKKFYLFGGYAPNTFYTSADTWELSVSGNCATGACTFAWRQMNTAGGISCSPECPTARRSHRMAEVNYFNRTPTAEPTCSSATAPCSFGIFMEGGTSDGTSFMADRWMFDPTANGGRGVWQKMPELPPRRLAASTSLTYDIPSSGQTAHRAILFGGETGMQSPPGGASSSFFVPPTLGDTWMYDYTTSSWNRVKLLGTGRFNQVAPYTTISSADARQTYNSIDRGLRFLRPLRAEPASAGRLSHDHAHAAQAQSPSDRGCNSAESSRSIPLRRPHQRRRIPSAQQRLQILLGQHGRKALAERPTNRRSHGEARTTRAATPSTTTTMRTHRVLYSAT